MENLRVILTKIQALLNELEAVLIEEIKQLSRLQINPVSLQVVSDNKSRLLSAINFYDQQRKHEEKNSRTSAPYQLQNKLAARWEKITLAVKRSSELNKRSFQLFEMHMRKVAELQKVLKLSGSATTLYGENGLSKSNKSGVTYNITI